MGLIDNKGRVFGRVNLIDLTLIFGVFVLIVMALVVMTKQGKISTVPEDKNVEYVLVVRAVRPEVASFVKKGDIVKKQITKEAIGKVKDVEIKPAEDVVITADGRRVVAISPLDKDVYITVETKGRVGGDIIATGNEVLRVGDRFTIFTKWFYGDAGILSMAVNGDQS